MKRQIIKTRPVQPYRIARLIIAAVVVIVVAAAVAFVIWTRTHAPHALAAHTLFALQDSANAASNPQSPVVLS